MRLGQRCQVLWAVVVLVGLVTTTPVMAHDVLYQGTVLAVESTRLHVKTIDEKSKKEVNVWFAVTKDTKVKRGDKAVSFADAKVVDGERVVVVVNHDAKVKNVATEIRLAAR